MIKKTHVKANDEVVVISGSAKGKIARVAQVIRKRDSVILSPLEVPDDIDYNDKKYFINPTWKTTRPSQEQQERTRVLAEAPIHISNVMKKEKWDAREANRAS